MRFLRRNTQIASFSTVPSIRAMVRRASNISSSWSTNTRTRATSSTRQNAGPSARVREDDGGDALLDRTNQVDLRQRLCDLASEMDHRGFHEVRAAGRPEKGIQRRPRSFGQEEDPRRKPGGPVRDQHSRTKTE